MPSNLITINHVEELTWVIPDSQMPKVLAMLSECGDKEIVDSTSQTFSLPYSRIYCQS